MVALYGAELRLCQAGGGVVRAQVGWKGWREFHVRGLQHFGRAAAVGARREARESRSKIGVGEGWEARLRAFFLWAVFAPIILSMTKLLERALEALRQLPEQSQDEIARTILRLAAWRREGDRFPSGQ